MGSWKSTIGYKLSKVLNMEFIDTDDVIEEMTGMKITDIFTEFGEKRFREMESAFFNEKTKQSRQIFSTGGGIVLDENNREILRQDGICFFLKAKPQTLAKRIHDSSKRPLVAGSKNLEVRLENIWNERSPYYKVCARHIITTDSLTPVQVLSQILNILEIPVADH